MLEAVACCPVSCRHWAKTRTVAFCLHPKSLLSTNCMLGFPCSLALQNEGEVAWPLWIMVAALFLSGGFEETRGLRAHGLK